MSDAYLGEIRLFAGNFAPSGWATCDGQSLSIAEYSALFNLLGTTFGGDGQTTFALPDLRGRVAAHRGGSLAVGTATGSETVTLTVSGMPTHTHVANATTAGTSASPAGAVWGADPGQNVGPYTGAPNGHGMAAAAIGSSGGSQPHANMQPFLALTFIIALQGIYPSPS